MAQYSRAESVRRWLPQLVQQTGRSAHELVQDGLQAGDFAPQGVQIAFEDDSLLTFRWAFYVRSLARPGVLAVFTEHCGYFEFKLGPDDTFQTCT